MHSFSYKTIVAIALALVLVVSSFLFGVRMGYENRPAVQKVTSVFNKEEGVPPTVDFAPFWRAWNIINEKYVAQEKPDDQERVYGAIQGLIGSLGDPYSSFFPPSDAEIFEQDISGEFQGVGMEIGMRDDTITVIAPLKGTPAERAGIRSGDKIVKIDDTLTNDLFLEDAVKLIRGEGGTEVVLTVVRSTQDGGQETKEIPVVRDTIELPVIDTRMYNAAGEEIPKEGVHDFENDVFVIHLFNFTRNSPYLFRDALREFADSGTRNLILDLRGNPGGVLDVAVDMASWFIPSGKIIVQEDRGDKGDGRIYRSFGYSAFNDQLRMVVLVDGGSASASEILAGALSEHGVATVVGTQTFGKGSVQELVPVTEDTFMKITIARWLTPNGVSISEEGITPDEVVEFDEEAFLEGRDLQLKRAVEILTR